mgnify:CR=1 FL=1
MAQEYKTVDATKKKRPVDKLKHYNTKHACGQLSQIIQYLMSCKKPPMTETFSIEHLVKVNTPLMTD